MTAARLSRKEKQQQTRAAIIDAATALFAKFGVEGTSMEAIARHAGLTQGAIYSNFASKADLWWAIADQMSRTLDLAEMFGTSGRWATSSPTSGGPCGSYCARRRQPSCC